jgi:hypothetical protein
MTLSWQLAIVFDGLAVVCFAFAAVFAGHDQADDALRSRTRQDAD